MDNRPGASDLPYWARRDQIAELALRWRPGRPIPQAPYDEGEHEVWRKVTAELEPRHGEYGCREFLLGKSRLALPSGAIPQLPEVSELLAPLTGFQYVPAAGLVPLRTFYESLATGTFHSTQYMRHHSVPLYTPEPDVIHEVVGHANCLASDRYAALYRAAGRAASRVTSEAALEFISRVFWFSLEFGVVHEDGALKAYGAGILSSYGELGDFQGMQVRPLDIAAMGQAGYDITTYQPVLFAALSFAHIEDAVGGFFAECDDDSIFSLLHGKVIA